jgi:hypothetical protein
MIGTGSFAVWQERYSVARFGLRKADVSVEMSLGLHLKMFFKGVK